MKLISYNVNGVRAAIKKGFVDWLKAAEPDVLGLQEIKSNQDETVSALFEAAGYTTYWYPAEKKGYSGVALLCKHAPLHVEYGLGLEKYDREGRAIRADYADFSFLNVYMPSGSAGEERQAFKYEWLDDFFDYVQELRKSKPNLIVCGDYNICHKPIDIHNPKRNAKTSGFLPEERAWMDRWEESGMIDTFRMFNPEPHNYSWWTYRAGARAKNLGWRIDYHWASATMKNRIKRALILPEAKHSDHCPVTVEIT